MIGLQEIIKSIPIFSTLSKNELNILTNMSYLTRYNSNYQLYYENDILDNLMFLIDGSLKIYKIDNDSNEVFLYHICKYNMISEISTLEKNEIQYLTNAITEKDCLILNINFKRFKEEFLNQNNLLNYLITELIFKNNQLLHVINRELIYDAKAKVANMLLHELERFNELQRRDVSSYLNIQPETLSRILNKFKKDESLSIKNGKIVIESFEKLKSCL